MIYVIQYIMDDEIKAIMQDGDIIKKDEELLQWYLDPLDINK